MRLNAFQKILVLIYLILLSITCVFYVPFRASHGRYEAGVIYDNIWSENSNIDLYRILIYILILVVTFYFLFRYLGKMSDLDVTIYKRRAKNELIVFLIFIISMSVCLITVFGTNGINRIRSKSLIVEIQKIQTQITENARKKLTRGEFWDESLKTFNLEEFDNRINRYWDAMMESKSDFKWLNEFYSKFPKRNLQRFSIRSPSDLKSFIESNAFNNADFKKEEENKILTSNLTELQNRQSSLTFYETEDIRRITLFCLAILFVTLYIARPLFLFIKSIFNEVR